MLSEEHFSGQMKQSSSKKRKRKVSGTLSEQRPEAGSKAGSRSASKTGAKSGAQGRNRAKKAEPADPQDAYKLYQSIRKPADDAMGERRYPEARRLYLKSASQIEAHGLEKEHRLSFMFAGAAACAMAYGRYLLALKHIKQAFEHMDENERHFLASLAYTVDRLMILPYQLKSKAQRQRLNELKLAMYRKFKEQILLHPVPIAPSETSTYIIHREKIDDDFSYLEDLDSEKSQHWLQEYESYSNNFIQLALLNFDLPREYSLPDRVQMNSTPFRTAGYFYFHRTEYYSRQLIVSRSKTLKGKAKVVLHGEEVCPPGYFINGFKVSENGKYLAYGISHQGSDWEEWRVRDLQKAEDLPQFKLNVRLGSVMFHPSSKGLIYYKTNVTKKSKDRFAVIDDKLQIYYRPLFPRGRKDSLIYRPKDRRYSHGFAYPIMKGKIMLISQRKRAAANSRFYLRKEGGRRPVIQLFGNKASNSQYLGYQGRRLFFLNYDQAERGKVIYVDLDKKQFKLAEGASTLIAQNKMIMVDVHLLKKQFLIQYLDERGSRSHLLRYKLNGEFIDEIELPFPGIITTINSRYEDNHIFFAMHDFARALNIYHHDLKTGKTSLLIPATGSPCKDLESKIVEVKSKDGTVIPMWLVYRRSTKITSNTPCLMYVYGGFNVSQLPSCSYEILSWTEMGGIWAQPYLRGGGELGEHWHKEACKIKKQKTYDDAIACARYLIDHKYSSAEKLAVKGGSNGGLTVGVLVNQAPELFACAISSNGLFDMMKFADFTSGWSWESDFGSLKKKNEFKAIRSYSPYHNLDASKNYPAFLICASAGDDRVPPWHSYKYAAALSRVSKKPVVLRVEGESGHHNPRSNWEVRDQQAFLKMILDF